MKIKICLIWVALATILAMAACILGCHNGSKELRLAAELNVYNWYDYLAPDTIANFEKEFGVKINLETYEDEEYMLSAVQSNPGKYDVVFPSDSLVQQMIDMKLLSRLNMENVPNIANIDQKFLNLDYDPGNQYSVPYSWGTTGIAVNTAHVLNKISSWGDLWDTSYQGKIGMLNNKFVVIGLTLKYLGYSINSTDPAELEQARAKLLEQRPMLAGYLSPDTYMEQLKSGGIWLAQAYAGDILLIAEENPDIKCVIPQEGSDFYLDCVVIPRDTPHKYTAEVFINYLLRPEVQAAIANYTHYACPNRTAIEQGLVNPQLLENPAVYPALDKLEAWGNPGLTEAIFNSIWAELQQ